MKKALIVLALLALEAHALAQTPETQWRYPARVRSTAGTGRSFAAGSGSLYLNPAAMTSSVQYLVEGNYTYGVNDDLNVVGVNWIDSYINRSFAAGFGYNYYNGGVVDGAGHSFDGAISFPLMSGDSSLHLGLAGRYFLQQWSADGLADRDVLTGDIGALLVVGENARLGIVGYNLLSSLDSYYKPAIGAGFSVWWASFGMAADLVADFGAVRDKDTALFQAAGGTMSPDLMADKLDFGMKYMGTMMFVPTTGFMLRTGYSFDALQEQSQLAAGLGFVVPKGVGFELAYSVELGNYENSFLGVAIQVFPMNMASSE
jgi:hypothetical protein